MRPIHLPSDPLFDVLFRGHLSSAIKRRGEDGYRLLDRHQTCCPGCGYQLPTHSQQMVRFRPVFCQTCGRLLVADNHGLASLFTALFVGAKQEVHA